MAALTAGVIAGIILAFLGAFFFRFGVFLTVFLSVSGIYVQVVQPRRVSVCGNWSGRGTASGCAGSAVHSGSYNFRYICLGWNCSGGIGLSAGACTGKTDKYSFLRNNFCGWYSCTAFAGIKKKENEETLKRRQE